MGAQMAKFMLSLRDESFKLLVSEAGERGISIQELIRAVIIPDWVKQNVSAKTPSTPSSSNGNSLNQARAATNGSIFQPTVTRIRG
jgi:hypothetical protein